MPNETTELAMVSVVLPTYNRADLLRRAIGSITAQTYRNLEIIVVDDASTDDTERVVEDMDDPRIRYIRLAARKGAPAARNTGIRAARGDFVAFQDSDDEWMPDKLEKQMAIMDSPGGKVDIVYSGFLRYGANTTVYIPEPRVAARQGDILSQLLLGNFVSTQTLLLRRGCLERAGMFDERMERYQDWELAIRLAKIYRFQLVDEPLVKVYETPGNISSDDAAAGRAVEAILEKHAALMRQHPVALAGLLLYLGSFKCRNGAMREGRRHMLDSARLRPFAVKTWVALALALFGSRVYRSGIKVTRWVRGIPA